MKKKNKVVGVYIALAVFIVAIVLCILLVVKHTSNLEIGITETRLGNHLRASFLLLQGTKEEKVKFNEGDDVTIDYNLSIKSGDFKFVIMDADGNVIETKEGLGEGEINLKVEKTQKYIFQFIAEQAKGKYEVSWEKSNN